MWDLPGPEMELMSPVFAGEFYATEPSGKPLFLTILDSAFPS